MLYYTVMLKNLKHFYYLLFYSIFGTFPYSFAVTSHLVITFSIAFCVFLGLNFIVYNSLYIIISPFLVFFPVLSMVVGSFLSLKQKKFKRLFVYSSITHMGFLFLSLSLLTLNSFHSFFLYFFLYVLMSLCI